MTGETRGDVPIFDDVARVLGVMLWPAPFRHGDGLPCYGCQSCLAEAYPDSDPDSDPDDEPAPDETESEGGHGKDEVSAG